MNHLRWIAVLGIFSLAILFAFTPLSIGGEGAKSELATYLVTSPHTAEECLASLDEYAAAGEKALDNWYWGCMAGDHTGYEILKASSEADALKTVPESLRAKAKATKLSKLTTEQVASMHEMKHEKKY